MTNFIEPHNEQWKAEFKDLKAILLAVLAEFDLDIQHVGSTAIPGLFAKPILDIDIIVEDKKSLYGISSRLEMLGYIPKGEQGIPGRFAFRQSHGETPEVSTRKLWQEHHLYVCFADSLALKNHLLFRDALLKDEKLVEQYSHLKIRLTKEKGMTRAKYTVQKTNFIVTVLSKLGLGEAELHQITNANQ